MDHWLKIRSTFSCCQVFSVHYGIDFPSILIFREVSGKLTFNETYLEFQFCDSVNSYSFLILWHYLKIVLVRSFSDPCFSVFGLNTEICRVNFTYTFHIGQRSVKRKPTSRNNLVISMYQGVMQDKVEVGQWLWDSWVCGFPNSTSHYFENAES